VKPGRRVLLWACLLTGVLPVASACGKKGPPLPPLQVAPARVEDLKVRRLGDDVHLQFTVPTKNSDGKEPADIATVEALAMTGEPVDRAGNSLSAANLALEATPIARMDVAPPAPPESDKDRKRREKAEAEAQKRGLPPPPPPPPPPPDPRPEQGDPVTFVETLTPAVTATPYVPRIGKPLPPRKPAEDEEIDDTPLPVMAKDVTPLRRVYVVAGRSKKGRLGGLSARIGVPLTEVPPVPPPPTLTYTDKAVTVSWLVPAGARLPVQQAIEPDSLPVRVLFPVAIPHTYNVYERPAAATAITPATPSAPAGTATAATPTPLNAAPLDTLTFDDPRVPFGVERCFEVRTVEAAGTLLTTESAPSPPVCVTAVDTFPPAPAGSLAAVGSEGAINLIWEPSTDLDIAGYVVLRGEAAGGPLAAITTTPIRETTYRDTEVRAGKRYVYAVVALDNASPQNVSVESNRVEETAR
jgi:predicted small lipoprotein YifL